MPGTSLLQLPDSLGKGINKMVNFFTGNKNVDIERHKRLTEAQTALDVAAIRGGTVSYRDNKLVPLVEPMLLEANKDLDRAEQNNLKDCLMLGLEQTSFLKDEEVSSEPLDDDWMLRWRQTARFTRFC
jgi:hypothetical protein